MKQDPMDEIRAKNPEVLRSDLSQAREKLAQLKNDLAAGKVKNVREINGLKRTIARMLTVGHAAKHAKA